MGGLRGPPESNGPPGELCLGGAAGEPLALACGNLPVCPECAAHPAPRDGYICRALTLAGRAPTPWRKASRPGRLLGVKAMRSRGCSCVGVPRTLGAPRHVPADTTRRGAPAGRDDATRLTRRGSLSAGPSADTKLVLCH